MNVDRARVLVLTQIKVAKKNTYSISRCSATQLSWIKAAGMGGKRTWHDATTWAASLSLAGFNDWRLPTTDASCSNSPNCPGSEIGHLDYAALGNPVGGLFANSGGFINLQSTLDNQSWFSTEALSR